MERDELEWWQQQSAAMRAGRWNAIDSLGVAEVLDAHARHQVQELQTVLRGIVLRLLKLARSSIADPRVMWVEELTELRFRVTEMLDASPTLVGISPALYDKAWTQVRTMLNAARRVALATDAHWTLPPQCPYELAQALDVGYLPDMLELGPLFEVAGRA